MMTIASDWGAYISALKTEQIPFKDLHDAGCLDVFIVKGDQEIEYISSTKNIAWARAAGVDVVGSYYWHYPIDSAQNQINLYSAAIRREQPDFIALDMEAGYGKSSWAISENGRFVCEGLQNNFPDMKIFIYTSRDFINGVTPDSNSWIGNYGRWIASWPMKPPVNQADWYMSFEEIKSYPLPGWTPALPAAWKGYDIWQNNNWARPEGYGWPYNHQYDWNYIPTSLDDFKRLIGMLPPVPVEPTLNERMDQAETFLKTLGYNGPK